MQKISLIVLLILFLSSASLVWAGEKEFEACRQKLKEAQKLDLLYDIKWNPPPRPQITVGPTFFTVPFATKEAFALTLNCFFMTGGPDFIDMDFLDWRSNKIVARFRYGKLKME